MTFKEALQAELIDIEVPDNLLIKAVIDWEGNPDEAYSGTSIQKKRIDLCLLQIYRGLLAQPDQKIGGMSTTLNRPAIQSRIRAIENKYRLNGGGFSW